MHTSESVVALSKAELSAQYHLLREEMGRRESGKFVGFVRAALADKEMAEEIREAGGAPIKVVWPTSEWDNGWFFDQYSGKVTLDNGETLELDLGDSAEFEELLSDQSSLSQPLGKHAELILDLRDGSLTAEMYGDDS